MARHLKRLARQLGLAVARRAARSYVVGPEVDDAVHAARWLAEQGFASTIGYWNAVGEAHGRIRDCHERALAAVEDAGLDCYLSVKAHAVAYRRELLEGLGRRAGGSGVRIHFDSHGPETADPTFALVRELASPGAVLGCTLPGRWARSVKDADWAVERDLVVRVVKGQWADPGPAAPDLREGFLAVVDRLAGRCRKVAVATHDVPLARESLRRLRSAGTPCELELLFGLPVKPSLPLAEEAGVRVRTYVPFGTGYLPYCLSTGLRNPRMLWWVARDTVLGRTLRMPRRHRGRPGGVESAEAGRLAGR